MLFLLSTRYPFFVSFKKDLELLNLRTISSLYSFSCDASKSPSNSKSSSFDTKDCLLGC